MNQQTFERQYKNYPAMVCLIKETEEQNRIAARKYSLSVVNEYNRDLKEFINLTNLRPNLIVQGILSVGLVLRIIKNIRIEYLKRIDKSVKLNKIERTLLKNYIVGKYRESVNPFIGQA